MKEKEKGKKQQVFKGSSSQTTHLQLKQGTTQEGTVNISISSTLQGV
uniref:Uncharacterized protein n=1 Tax=Nelumbo nucifera TaxID=4432 RepID=A0A822ZQY2_NELNU|nr:TPA_asm: hypothetical protein HUJ06_017234 [Nelumbo nucifera]